MYDSQLLFNWNNVFWGANLLLAQLSVRSPLSVWSCLFATFSHLHGACCVTCQMLTCLVRLSSARCSRSQVPAAHASHDDRGDVWGTQNQPAFHRQMQYFLKYWLCGTGGVPIQYTPLGRSWNQNDGSLGTTANAVFLSTLYGSQVAR